MTFIFLVVLAIVVGVAFRYAGKHRSSIMTPIGLLIDYLQITAMVLSMEAGWPQSAKDSVAYMTSIPSLNMDFLAAECSVQATYETKFAASLLLPVVIAILLTITYLVRAKLFRKRRGLRKLMSSGLLLLGLVYMALTTTTLAHFDCTRQVDGSLTLDVAPSIDCFSDEWYRLLPAAICGIIFYVVGIPGLLLGIYTRYRFRMREAAVALSIGGEFEQFRPRYAFWAPLLMVRKLSLVLAKIFFTSVTAVQLVAALIVIVLSIMTQLRWQPYADEKMNTLETIFLASSAFVLALGTMLQTATFVGTEAVNGIGWTVFVVVLLNTLIVVIWLAWELLYQLRLRHATIGTKAQRELMYELFAADRIHPVHEYVISRAAIGEAEAFFEMLAQIGEVATRFDRLRTRVPHNSAALTLLNEFTLRAFHAYHIGAVAHWLRHEASKSDVDLFRLAFESMAKKTYAVNGRSLRKQFSRLFGASGRLPSQRSDVLREENELENMIQLVVSPLPSVDLQRVLMAVCRQARFSTANVIGRATAYAPPPTKLDIAVPAGSTPEGGDSPAMYVAEGLLHIATVERVDAALADIEIRDTQVDDLDFTLDSTESDQSSSTTKSAVPCSTSALPDFPGASADASGGHGTSAEVDDGDSVDWDL